MGHLRSGNYDEARRAVDEALAGFRADGDEYGIALSAMHLAHCDVLEAKDLDAARDTIVECRDTFERLGVRAGVGESELVLGLLLRDRDARAAAQHLLAALEEPDAHWYLSTKCWVVQLAAGMGLPSLDAGAIAELVADYYESAPEPQPRWVLDDLDVLRSRARDVSSDVMVVNGIDTAIDQVRAALAQVASAI